MKVFKWVLIALGTLVLVFVAVIVGWLATIETVKLTAADLDVGGSYPAEERQALFDACKSNRENEAFDEGRYARASLTTPERSCPALSG